MVSTRSRANKDPAAESEAKLAKPMKKAAPKGILTIEVRQIHLFFLAKVESTKDAEPVKQLVEGDDCPDFEVSLSVPQRLFMLFCLDEAQ